MTKPSLTIVMPFYNEVAFLDLGVASVLSQRIDDLEVIIVNDNPEQFDQTFFEKQNFPTQVKVVHHAANAGLSQARNTGIKHAEGKWVGFLDSDDYYLPLGLKAQFDTAEKTNADMIHGLAVRNGSNAAQAQVCVADAQNNATAVFAVGRQVPEAGFGIFSSWSSLYKREFLTRADLRFDVEQRIFEDRLFVVNAISHAQSLVKMAKPVRVWRRRESSITTSPNSVADSLLKLKAFEKCIDHWLSVEGLRGFGVREFVRIWLHTLTQSTSSPFEHAFGDIAGPDAKVHDALLRILSKYDFTKEELGDCLKADIRHARRTGPNRMSTADFLLSIESAVKGDNVTLRRIYDAFNNLPAKPPAPAIETGRTDPYMEGVEFHFHVGLHKTGSTFIQNMLRDNREQLAKNGLLFPTTGLGFPDGVYPVRPGGLPGHQALLWAVNNDPEMFDRLRAEIRASGCKKVLISAENLSAPLSDEDHRTATFDRLLAMIKLSPGNAHVFAMVRRPDIWIDRYFREIAGNGAMASYQSIDEFALNNERILSLPHLFGGFEARTGHKVRLGNFDELTQKPLVEQVLALCGCDAGLAASLVQHDHGRYPSPCNAQVEIARLVTLLQPNLATRQATLQAFSGMVTPTDQHDILLTPDARQKIVNTFMAESAEFAADRGYTHAAPDWKADIANAPASGAIDIPERYIQAMMQSATWAAALPTDDGQAPQKWTAQRIAKGILRRVLPNLNI